MNSQGEPVDVGPVEGWQAMLDSKSGQEGERSINPMMQAPIATVACPDGTEEHGTLNISKRGLNSALQRGYASCFLTLASYQQRRDVLEEMTDKVELLIDYFSEESEEESDGTEEKLKAQELLAYSSAVESPLLGFEKKKASKASDPSERNIVKKIRLRLGKISVLKEALERGLTLQEAVDMKAIERFPHILEGDIESSPRNIRLGSK